MEEPAGDADRGILRNRAFLALWAAQICPKNNEKVTQIPAA